MLRFICLSSLALEICSEMIFQGNMHPFGAPFPLPPMPVGSITASPGSKREMPVIDAPIFAIDAAFFGNIMSDPISQNHSNYEMENWLLGAKKPFIYPPIKQLWQTPELFCVYSIFTQFALSRSWNERPSIIESWYEWGCDYVALVVQFAIAPRYTETGSVTASGSWTSRYDWSGKYSFTIATEYANPDCANPAVGCQRPGEGMLIPAMLDPLKIGSQVRFVNNETFYIESTSIVESAGFLVFVRFLAAWSWAIVLISIFLIVKSVSRGLKRTFHAVGLLLVLFLGGVVGQFFVALHFTFGPTILSTVSGFFNTNYMESIVYGGIISFSYTATVLLSVLWVGMVVPPNPTMKILVKLCSILLTLGAFVSAAYAWIRSFTTIGNSSDGEYFILFADGGLDTILRLQYDLAMYNGYVVGSIYLIGIVIFLGRLLVVAKQSQSRVVLDGLKKSAPTMLLQAACMFTLSGLLAWVKDGECINGARYQSYPAKWAVINHDQVDVDTCMFIWLWVVQVIEFVLIQILATCQLVECKRAVLPSSSSSSSSSSVGC